MATQGTASRVLGDKGHCRGGVVTHEDTLGTGDYGLAQLRGSTKPVGEIEPDALLFLF